MANFSSVLLTQYMLLLYLYLQYCTSSGAETPADFETIAKKLQYKIDILMEQQRHDSAFLESIRYQLLDDKNTNTASASPKSTVEFSLADSGSKVKDQNLKYVSNSQITQTVSSLPAQLTGKDLQKTIGVLESDSQRLHALCWQVNELKKSLEELLQSKTKDVVSTVETGELHMEIDSLRRELQKLKSQTAVQEENREQGRHLANQIKNDKVTIKWLQKTVGELRSELVEIASSYNLSTVLQQKQELENKVNLLQGDITGLRRELDEMKAYQKQDTATVVQLQQELTSIRNMQHKTLSAYSDMKDEMKTLKRDLRLSHTKRLSSELKGKDKQKSQGKKGAKEKNKENLTAMHKIRHRGMHARLEIDHVKETVKEVFSQQTQLMQQLVELDQEKTTLQSSVQRISDEMKVLVSSNNEYHNLQGAIGKTVNDMHERLTVVEEKNKRTSDSIRNITQKTSSIDKLHSSTLQLFESVKTLEDKYDQNLSDLQKEVSKLEFNMAQMTSTFDVLKEDQADHYQVLKGVKKNLSVLQQKQQGDHIRVASLQNTVLNDTLKDYKDENKELLQDMRIANLEAKMEDMLSQHNINMATLPRQVTIKPNNYSDVPRVGIALHPDDSNMQNNTLPRLINEIGVLEKRYKLITKILPKDCSHAKVKATSEVSGVKATSAVSGVELILPEGASDPVAVYCDMHTDGGGWTVIQRRIDGKEDFNRDWQAYKVGFGNTSGEYWIGNDVLHLLTQDNHTVLHIDMWDIYEQYWVAEYETFYVGAEDSGYQLYVNGFHGNASDSMEYHQNMKFSTIDTDHDISNTHCAQSYQGGWWYSHCQHINVNGKYNIGLTWYNSLTNEWIALTKVEMKVKKNNMANKLHENTF